MSFLQASKEQTLQYNADYARVFNAAVAAMQQNPGFVLMMQNPQTGVVSGETRLNMMSWGENILVRIVPMPQGGCNVTVRSQLKYGVTSWGRNDKNIQALIQAINAQLGRF